MSQSQGSGTRGTRSQSQQPPASTSPNTNTNANANANGSQDDYADDTIRIMLATDNHIGYMERDPIRGQDSINTFREILQLAVKHEVDLILLGGDLFHENKPSRECLYNVTALLREFTLGDKPVQVELLSDPLEGKAHGYTFPAVNYEDPNLNVGIPVFSIHGNHDDPQGAGADGALSALDILSVTGLVNYMGKFDLPMNDSDTSTPGIMVRPVLLRKGGTRLGLYGVGNVKDQRMHFELRSNRVRMFMPRDKERWFNLMVVHQNRVKHGPQEYVPEGMFDDSIDLVVWGHEHDCRIIPEPVAGKNYYITQPGSSVATSLADGEAVEKHVALLQIQRKEFKLTPIPLRTVRPFVIEEVVLSDAAEEEGAQLDLGDQMSITRFLRAKVNKLIDRANQLWDERNKRAVEEGEEELPRMLPLVRLKVDTTGVTETSNPIRFGQEFTGRIANPRDLLVFHRSKKASLRSSLAQGSSSSTTKVTADDPDLSIDDPTLTTQEKLAKVRVGTLVREYLKAQELQLLGEGGMSDAIRMFVEKDDAHAIQTHVNKALKVLMKNVQPSVGAAGVGEDGEVDEGDLEEMLAKAREQQEKEYTAAQESAKPSKANGKGKGKSNENAAESDRESVDSMMMDLDDIPGMPRGAASDDFDAMFDDDEEDEPPPPKRKTAAGTKGKAAAKEKAPAKGKAKAPAKKAAAGAKGKGKKKAVESDEEDEAVESDFNEDDDEEEDEAPPPKPAAKRTNRAAVLSQPTTAAKKAPAKKSTAAAGGGRGTKQTQQTQQTQSQLTFAPAGRTSGRAAAGRARGKMVVDDDDDDDE